MMRRIFIVFIFGIFILPMGFALALNNMSVVTVKPSNEGQAIVVLEPPVNFKTVAVKLGYKVGAEYDLEELSMKAIKVFVPNGRTVDAAITQLEIQFPDIVVADSEV